MISRAIAAAFFCGAPAIAQEPAYTDQCYNSGSRVSLEAAIEACTTAIDSGRWHGKDLAWAYNDRGLARWNKGDVDGAFSDYDQATRLDPNYELPYFNRGVLYLYLGVPSRARAELERASELKPEYAYNALWLDILDRRSGSPSHLAAAIKRIDMTKWPAPVIRLYLGQSTTEAVLAAAGDPKADTKRDNVCEADFYTGELARQQGRIDEAKRLFDLVAANCAGLTEYGAALAELKALRARP
jgi:lipoprotein NlpI